MDNCVVDAKCYKDEVDMIRLQKICSSQLDYETLNKIIELNHTKFEISEEMVKNVIREKQIIHLYTNDVDNRLVGVIGFRRDIHQGIVYLYIGGSVVHDDYQKSGLLTKSLLHEILVTYIKYPFRDKYALAFCTTPEAYQYFCCLDYTWPKRSIQTPEQLIKVQTDYLPLIGVDDYIINDGAIVSHKMKGKIKELNPSKHIKQQVVEYFTQLVESVNDGSQILCITKFNSYNLLMVVRRRIAKRLINLAKYIKLEKLFIARK